MNQLKLNDGRQIPRIGLGTWKSTDANEAYQAVVDAVKLGYRHIDCAWVYGNEGEIGRAIADLISAGVVTREDLWITSKLWNHRHEPELVEGACRQTIETLGLDYLDLYLIHWPLAFHRESPFPKKGSEYLSLEEASLEKTWEAMEALKLQGLAKSIGVSNFSTSHLSRVLSTAKIPPAINQVELHPYLCQEKLLAYCLEHKIALTAYSPLGSGGTAVTIAPGQKLSPLEDPLVRELAQKYEVDPGSILISWALHRGTIVIPKSSNRDRIASNFKAASLSLSADDMVNLEGLDKGLRIINPSMWLGDDSPYSEDQLWSDD